MFRKNRTWELVKWRQWASFYEWDIGRDNPRYEYTKIWYASSDGKMKVKEVAGWHTDAEIRKLWPKP